MVDSAQAGRDAGQLGTFVLVAVLFGLATSQMYQQCHLTAYHCKTAAEASQPLTPPINTRRLLLRIACLRGAAKQNQRSGDGRTRRRRVVGSLPRTMVLLAMLGCLLLLVRCVPRARAAAARQFVS